MTKYTDDSSNFGADGPFFHIIREGLKGLAEGEDYFDLLTDDVVFEYVVSVPGYPQRVEGRHNIINLYNDYDRFMTVRGADNLHVYRDPAASSRSSNMRSMANQCRPGVRTTTGLSPSSRSRTGK